RVKTTATRVIRAAREPGDVVVMARTYRAASEAGRRSLAPRSVDDLADGCPGAHRGADAREEGAHDPRAVRDERLFHLHRLEDDDEIARGDRRTLGDGDLDDRALHRRGERGAVRRGGALGPPCGSAPGSGTGTTAADGESRRDDDLEP